MIRHQAILNTHPTVVTVNGENEAWDEEGNVVEIDESLVQPEVDRLQAEYDSKEYQRQREAEYPDIKDQLDYIYHNGIESWKTEMIDPVKAKYPKPE